MSNRDLNKDAAQTGIVCTVYESHGPAMLSQTDHLNPKSAPSSHHHRGLAVWLSVIGALCLLLTLPLTAVHASETDPSGSQSWADGVDTRRMNITEQPDELLDASAEIKRISKYVQALKTEVIDLNNDLRLMEEQLLFPSETKYSIFVSLSSGQFFTLESVKLVLNGKLVATHIYSENQRQAMLRGGIHRMYVTNLNEGKHSATAFFTGIGPNGREYKRASNIDFEKGPSSKYLELAIGDDAVRQEPVFAIKQW